MDHGSVHAEEHLAEKQLYRKGPEFLVDSTLNMSQQHALAQKAANGILGCIRNVVRRTTGRKGILPSQTREYCVQFWTPQYKREADITGGIQQRTMKKIMSVSHIRKGWES